MTESTERRARAQRAPQLTLLFMGLALALAPCRRVHAYEDQLTLGAGIGYAYRAADSARHGASLSIDASLGLTQSWSARGWLGYSLHPGSQVHSRVGVGGELLYLFDVLAVVPYVGAGLDVLALANHEPRSAPRSPPVTPALAPADAALAATSASAREASLRFDLGLHPVLGVDWLVTRALIVGFVVRPILVLTDLRREPLYLTATLTASVVRDL